VTGPEFAVEPEGDGRWRVRGELDFHTAPQLLATIAERPADGQSADVVFDCAELTFVDSQGVRAFIILSKGLPTGASLVLDGVRRNVRRVLELVQLDQAPNVRIDA
jgi:anti-anti-sigma factor